MKNHHKEHMKRKIMSIIRSDIKKNYKKLVMPSESKKKFF